MILSVLDWWYTLNSTEHLYYGIAILFSVLFLIQIVITFIGLETDLDVDLHDVDHGFSIFSIRGIIAFGLFFGWGGVLALQFEWQPPQVLMLAFLSGFVAMVAIAYIFAQILKLQESGTVDLSGAVMRRGEVYLPIPAGGKEKGKISISIEGKLMEFDAVSNENEAIQTGSKVQVLEIMEDNVFKVKSIS